MRRLVMPCKTTLRLLSTPSIPFMILLVSVFATSCGLKKESKKNQQQVVNETLTEDAPIMFPFYDSECQSSSSLQSSSVNLSNLKLQTVDKYGNVSEQPLKYSNPRNLGLTLATSSIEIINSNRSHQKNCESESGTVCNMLAIDPDFYKQPSQPMKICESHTYLPTHSQEAVALTTRDFVSRMANFHESATGRRLASVAIEALPLVSVLLKNAEYKNGTYFDKILYHADNAYFDGANGSIMVLPVTQKYQDLRDDFNIPYLWQSDFVIAHEYSHYIQRTILDKIGVTSALKRLGFKWDGARHKMIDDHSIGHANSFVKKRSDPRLRALVSSIFEGFADTLPYYAAQGRSESMNSLGKMMVGRDLNLSTVSEGSSTEKKLTVQGLENVAGTRYSSGWIRLKSSHEAQAASGGDPHFLGGMISHLVNSVFASVIPDNSFTADKKNLEDKLSKTVSKKRYLSTLEWFEKYFIAATANLRKTGSYIDSRELLRIIPRALLDVVEDGDEIPLTFSKSKRVELACKVMKEKVEYTLLPNRCR